MKKLKRRRIFILIAMIFVVLFVKNKLQNQILPNLSKLSNEEYQIMKQDENKNYSGIGQEKVKNKDGYYTTFTTTSTYQKTYIEYKQNGNSSWKNHSYWGGTMEENGCGITAIATLLSGYKKDLYS